MFSKKKESYLNFIYVFNHVFILILFFLIFKFQNGLSQNSAPRIVINSMGHTAKIQHLVFTPDGKKIISVSEDKTIRIWDSFTGDLLKRLDLQIGDSSEGVLYASAISPNGRLLAVGGHNLTRSGEVYITIINLEQYVQVGYASGHTGSINDLAFSNDGNYLISGSDDATIRIWKMDVSENRSLPIHAQISVNGPVKSLTLNRITMDLAVATEGSGIITTYNIAQLELGELQLKPKVFNRHKGEINKLLYSPDGNYLASAAINNELNLWKADGSLLKQISKNRLVNAIAFSGDSKILLSLDDTGKGISYGLPSLITYTTFMGHNNTVFSASFSPLDALGYMVASAGGTNNEIILWNPISGKEIRRMRGKGRAINKILFGKDLDLSIEDVDGGKKLFDFKNMKEKPFSNINDSSKKFNSEMKLITAYKLILKNGKTITNDEIIDGRILDFCVTQQSHVIVASDFSLKMYDANGNYGKEFIGHVGGVRTVDISEDNTYLASGGEDQTIILWKLNENGSIPTLRHYFTETNWANFFSSLPFDSLTYIPSKGAWKRLIELLKLSKNKYYRVIENAYNTNLGEPILPFVSYFSTDDNEWVCWAYKGYFACSSGGENYFGWHVNNGFNNLAKFYSAQQYFNVLFKPEELKISLQTAKRVEDILRAKGERLFDLTRLHRPSSSYFSIRKLLDNGFLEYKDGITSTKEKSLDLDVILKDGGGGIKEVLIYRNDKLIVSDQTIKTATEYEEITKTYKLDLVNDVNEFKVIAINYQKIESEPEVLKIVYKGDPITNSTLHVLAIGINNYKNTNYSLNFAETDAKAFCDKLTGQSLKLFKNINVKSIYNEAAIKTNIKSAFDSIAAIAKPEDVFVFFYAGHGALVERNQENSSNGLFYLVPSDVTKIVSDENQLIEKGFSAEELKECLTNIKSTKQLVLMDACHSGGAVKNLTRSAGGEEKAIFQLARSSGVACIASSGTKQIASEFEILKHGVFTYALLEALQGKALNKSFVLTVSQLKSYMEERVPELTKLYKGESQYPTGFITGSVVEAINNVQRTFSSFSYVFFIFCAPD